MQITVSSNIKEVQKQLHSFERKALKSATVRALNKTGTSVTAEAARRIKSRTALPIGRIKKKMKIRKARRGYYVWSVVGLRAATNIIEWVTPAKQAVGAFRKQKGVRSRAWGRSKVYPGTFIAPGKNSGKLLVYVRDQRKTSGIRGVQGPSVRSAFYQELKDLEPYARKRFGVVFEREVSYEIQKFYRR